MRSNSYPQSKPVIVTHPDGTEVEYVSQSEAGRREPITHTDVSDLCRRRRKHVKGYKARFKTVSLSKNDE